MRPGSFQSRIILLFVGLIALVQVSAFMAVDAAIKRNARAQIRSELTTGGRVFGRLVDSRNQRLAEAARVLSADFALKMVVSTRDHGTLLSAMENHQSRIGADLMMVVSLEDTVMADTLRPAVRGGPFAFPWLLRNAEEAGEASAFLALEGRTYQLVVVPLLAPVPIAWICMGFVVDSRLAEELRALTSSQVSFLQTRPGGAWTSFASTLPPAQRQTLLDALAKGAWDSGESGAIGMGDAEHETLLIRLARSPDADISAALQLSLAEAMRPYRPLRLALLALFLGGVGVSLLGGVWIARSVSKPVHLLAEGARRIEQGDYEHRVAITQQDELGQLAATFNTMTKGIAEREAHIRHQAYHDTLTGLPNRTFLHHQLEQGIRQVQRGGVPLALLLMDVDRFKEVNDTLGHHIGDRILQELGPRLRQAVREWDTVARLGGDEFAVLLPGATGPNFAIDAGERILRALQSPFWVEGLPLEVGVSIGIALCPEHGEDANDLIRRADVAMYLAKRSTSGWAVYSRELDQHSARRLTLVGELRQAIEAEQLALYCQPKVELATGRVADVEALVSWHHPKHGLMAPDEFVPLAEQTGLIRPLSLWVLGAALKQCRLWQQAGITLGIAVNLSTRILQDRQFPDQLARLLAEWDVPPIMLALEVTESAIMTDPACAKEVLTRLDAMGVRLAVDDFGTGYSSLTYLKELPVDELKIDKSFVMDLTTDSGNAMIVRSTIDLGHNLGLKVTAEGVETDEIWRILETLGCDLAQGYFISRPLPIAEVPHHLNKLQWDMGGKGPSGRA